MSKQPYPIHDGGPTCGSCHWWVSFDEEGGECYYNPPMSRMLKDDSVDVWRPITLRTEPSCSKFKGRN